MAFHEQESINGLKIGPVMGKKGPVMKVVGRKVFYINSLYGVEMRGEEDTGGGG